MTHTALPDHSIHRLTLRITVDKLASLLRVSGGQNGRYRTKSEKPITSLSDPAFTVIARRWVKDLDDIKQPVDRHRRVKPWWKADGAGNLVLVLKSGLKTIEIEKGKPGVVVRAPGHLEAVLGTLIAATKAGERHGALEAASGSGDGRGIPRRAKAA